MTAEGDFHNLAGARGNHTFKGCHGETAAERGVGKGQAKGGINQSNIGKLQLYEEEEPYDAIKLLFCTHFTEDLQKGCSTWLSLMIVFYFSLTIFLKRQKK